MPGIRMLAALVVVAILAGGCARADEPYDGALAGDTGGATSVDASGPQAFSLPAPNLEPEGLARFRVGDRFFTDPWVPAAPPPDGRDPDAARNGLGPTYVADSCMACHMAVGKASAPAGETVLGSLVRLDDPSGAYGPQIQDRAVSGVPAEARIVVDYREESGTYPDGTGYGLQIPVIELRDPGFGPMPPGASLRVSPHLIGLGLLEAISPDAVRASADPDDDDGDGISGRAALVWSDALGGEALGRLGWKASAATVADQTAAAFHQDLGITSAMHPEQNCPPAQAECAAAPSGGDPEIGGARFDAVVFYTQTLAVPRQRRTQDPDVKAGAELFRSVGCDACHLARFTTGDHEVAAVAGQVIYPYSDLLLHDMGEGLAGAGGESTATNREWRTPPLWGIGLVQRVNPLAGFLHDGRARTLEEAVLWHGGEAAAAAGSFRQLDGVARRRVIAFLESL